MSLPSVFDTLRLPVVAAPLFIISNPDLLIAECKAGIVGSFPALNARPIEVLDQWLARITDELDRHNQETPDSPAAPFAVNQIVHRSNDRLMQDVELCVKHKVPIVITSLGARPEVNDAIHSYGGITLHDVISNRFAKKAIEKGSDGLIAVAAGAGGHAGAQSPFALVQEIREWFDGPLLLSGSIANGKSVLATQVMGADLAYIGSPFIATHEANAAAAYKRMITDCGAEDIVYTPYFTGVSGNYLKPSLEANGLDPDDLPIEADTKMQFGEGESTKTKTWKDIWGSGQGIGATKEIVHVTDRVAELKTQYDAAKAGLQATLEA